MSSKPVVVIGDGWAALGAVGFLVRTGAPVRWLTGSGSRILPPLPSLEAGAGWQGPEVWALLARELGIECGLPETGSYLREFRNKAFREPSWSRAPSPEAKASVIGETLWEPEQRLIPIYEARLGMPLQELEAAVRAALTPERFPNLLRTEEVPVTAVQLAEGQVSAVFLGTGERIECEKVIYADRWSAISRIQGLPKAPAFLRKREPLGMLQAAFAHELPLGAGLQEGFYGALHREPGDETDKHVWGYFSSDGRRSYWTVLLTSEEGEDNHLIAKKLRRIKSALDKMFTGESWLPAGKADFLSNVSSEHVRFEEAALFGSGEALREPATVPQAKGIAFVTDGYGPSCALHQVAAFLGLMTEAGIPVQGESETPEYRKLDSSRRC